MNLFDKRRVQVNADFNPDTLPFEQWRHTSQLAVQTTLPAIFCLVILCALCVALRQLMGVYGGIIELLYEPPTFMVISGLALALLVASFAITFVFIFLPSSASASVQFGNS